MATSEKNALQHLLKCPDKKKYMYAYILIHMTTWVLNFWKSVVPTSGFGGKLWGFTVLQNEQVRKE